MGFTQTALCLLLYVGVSGCVFLGEHHCIEGRDVFVHLFEWKWIDIAIECETFLQYHGYCAVQVSPVSEHRLFPGYDGREPFPWWYRLLQTIPVVSEYFKGYPWWQRYQPVSYDVISRSGTEAEFVNMVERCNNVGVHVYVDVILNHMTAPGLGVGSGGHVFVAEALQYPGVPYNPCHFHTPHDCPTPSQQIDDFTDIRQLRNCRLCGLMDLDDDHPYVQETQIEFLNKLIDIGVAGFRIDAAKHMWPHALHTIYSSLHHLSSRWFPDKELPFVFQEVIDLTGHEASGCDDYKHLAAVTEFRYCYDIAKIIRKDTSRLHLKDLSRFTSGYQDGRYSVVFIDNHDNQRGHGPGGIDIILTHFEPNVYKMAIAFMLAWPYGYPRIMSSYEWPRLIKDGHDVNDWIGPPSVSGHTKHVICNDGWVCEHRWKEIRNMVRFHNAVSGMPMTRWWDDGADSISFSRGSRGFFLLNNRNDGHMFTEYFTVDLPDGVYCDVITCDSSRPISGECLGPRDVCRRVLVERGSMQVVLGVGEMQIFAVHV